MNTIRLNRSYAAILVLFVAGIVSYFYFNGKVRIYQSQLFTMLLEINNEISKVNPYEFEAYKEDNSNKTIILPSVKIFDGIRKNLYYYTSSGELKREENYFFRKGKWVLEEFLENTYDDNNNIVETYQLEDGPIRYGYYRRREVSESGGKKITTTLHLKKGKWIEIERELSMKDKLSNKEYYIFQEKIDGKWETVSRYETEYDNYGRETKVISDDRVTVHKYDSSGNNIYYSELIINKGKIVRGWKKDYIYNENGKLLSSIEYVCEEDLVWQLKETIAHRYDNHGNLIQIKERNNNHNVVIDQFFNERGLVTKKVIKRFRLRTPEVVAVMLYHPFTGKIIVEIAANCSYWGNNKMVKNEYKYSNYGRLLEQNHYVQKNDGVWVMEESTKCSYDENNNVVSAIVCPPRQKGIEDHGIIYPLLTVGYKDSINEEYFFDNDLKVEYVKIFSKK